jgi:hypothetical protein
MVRVALFGFGIETISLAMKMAALSDWIRIQI